MQTAQSNPHPHKGILLDVTHADPQASTTTHANWQRDQRWNRRPSLRGAKASALRSSRTSVLWRAQLKTYYLSGGKLWPPRGGGLRIHRRTSDALCRREAWRNDDPQKRACKERLLQVVSVATRVAISRRVQRYKQARSTWATKSGGQTNEIDIEHIDTNDLWM